MSPFTIEYAEGVSATIYVANTLTPGELLELHQTIDRLPSSANVLRIQLTSDVAAGMPRGLGEFVRHWRETRRRPVHLILAPRAVSDSDTLPSANRCE